MKREEYLKELKNCIQALPIEEQNEALDYYFNYFEDANDDEKVISELGSPEELAEEIKAKFACVPAQKNPRKSPMKTRTIQETESRVIQLHCVFLLTKTL
jgi:uncharacterized membrane protein